jgi:hypothetical protein
MAVDDARLTELLNTFVGDMGATMHAGSAVVGHRLGLYRALAEKPATAGELADRTGCHPRYLTEWLRGQAAGGYVTVDLATETYSMSEEQEFALTNPDGPVYLPGAFLMALGALRAESRITEAFRSGAGLGWHEHDDDVFDGCEQFFRPGYVGNLLTEWLPALDGVVDRLHAGARVADVGCGHGASTVLMALGSTIIHVPCGVNDSRMCRAASRARCSSARTITPDRSARLSRVPRTPGWATGCGSTWQRRRTSVAARSTW